MWFRISFSCSALIGASIFISTVVLGTIIILVNVRSEHIGKRERRERESEQERERERERDNRVEQMGKLHNMYFIHCTM